MSIEFRILPMGDMALLVETTDTVSVLALTNALTEQIETAADVWAEIDDVVPAARTVLLVARDSTDLAVLANRVRSTLSGISGSAPPAAGATREIPVRYNGPDLAEVAELTGLSAGEIVAAHTDTPWRVAFGGFVPGFAYLVGGDPRLQVPRRSEPRTHVPAGTVALGGEYSAIYPRDSPGGWQLIGTTSTCLWDPSADPPALLSPGMTVRFVADH